MNVHDSERLTGLLEDAGYVAAPDGRAGRRRRLQHLRGARERRQQALRQPRPPRAGQGGATRACRSPSAAAWRRRTAATITAQGAVGRRRLRHPQHRLAAGAARARAAQRGGAGRDPRVARGLPVDAADQARVGVRRLGVDLGRLQQHLHVLHRPGAARQGEGPPARRRSSPRSRRWSPRASSRSPCSGRTSTPTASSSATGRRSASCCAPAARSTGLERVRFTCPHPADFTDDVIEAMAETPNVMPQLHMPLQSGSDRVLKAMRRSYRQRAVPRHHRPGPRRDARRRDHHRHHRRLPRRDRGGLPGRRCDVVAQARFAGAFTFQYSKRPGTPAATHARPGAEGRSCRSATSGWSRWSGRHRLGGEPDARRPRRVEVLVAEGEGRKDAATHRLSGRARDNRLVHFTAPAGRRRRASIRPGDWSPSRSPTPPRTTWSPTAPCSPYAVPAPATPGRPARAAAGRRRRRRSACRPSACPPRSPRPACG